MRHEFQTMVNMWHLQDPRALQQIKEWKDTWPTQSRWSRTKRKGMTVTDYAKKTIWRFVPAQTPSGLLLSAQGRREYVDGLDLSRCPALSLVLQVGDKIHADVRAHAGTGDILDSIHLCAIPYCDMTTLDSRMHNIVLQTAVGKSYRDRVARSLQDALNRLRV